MSRPLALAVLISGNGSNLQAIIDAIEADRLNAEIRVVVSNEPGAFGLERARKHGLEVRVIDHRDFERREQFDQSLRECLQRFEPDYIVLAGFMRILGPALITSFEYRILNIHPSLLPAYRGLDTYRRALENNEPRHGVSIHLVTPELDAGPVLAQASYPIEAGDDVADLEQKGHRLEHRMYPRVLSLLADGKLAIDGGQPVYERKPLEQPLQFSD